MSSGANKFVSIDDANRESSSESDTSRSGRNQSESSTDRIGAPEPPEPIEAEYIDPTAVPIGNEPRRTRDGRIDGRTKSGRARREKVSQTVGVEGLTIKDLLIGIHSMAAGLTGIPECEIDENEAKKLGDSLEELGKIYGKSISPKALAWTNFSAALGVVYGPRFVAYQARIKEEKAAKPGPKIVQNVNATQRVPPTNAPPPKADQHPTPSQFWSEPYEGF
jgi:hypothetical protein